MENDAIVVVEVVLGGDEGGSGALGTRMVLCFY